MIARIATLEEIERHYDLVDVIDANIALDLKERSEDLALKGVGKK